MDYPCSVFFWISCRYADGSISGDFAAYLQCRGAKARPWKRYFNASFLSWVFCPYLRVAVSGKRKGAVAALQVKAEKICHKMRSAPASVDAEAIMKKFITVYQKHCSFEQL